MIEVSKLLPEHQYIFSIGEYISIEHLKTIPTNVYVFRKVDQIYTLRFTDIMINHGGLNSITECINNNVPMIVFPLSKIWDEKGNSARVVYHKIGLRGQIKRDSPSKIASIIKKVLFEYSEFYNTIFKLNNLVTIKYSSKNIYPKLEYILED